MVRQRVRIRFRKAGDLRLIGHRDLVRTIERVLRRAELRLGMSEGFHPKPRMSFPSALALGIAGMEEVAEVELAEECPGSAILQRLSASTVPGLDFLRAELLPDGAKKAQIRSSTYQIELPPDRLAEAEAKAAALRGAETFLVDRPRGGRAVDVCASLEHVGVQSGRLTIRLAALSRGGASPRDVLAALGLIDLERDGYCLTRTAVELQP
jgi:radical SAM-linked protein